MVMDENELFAMTVVKLKERLKKLGLPISGKKAVLVARLLESEPEEVEEEEVVLILDDDDDDSTYAAEFDMGEVLEAEVFEAEILEDEDESDIANTVPSSIKMSPAPFASRTVWYKDGTTIATLLVILLMAGAGGWWYLNEDAAVFQTAPSRYGDNLQFTVTNGLLLADGEEMVGYIRDAAGGGLDQVCGELRIDFSGTGSASITDGSLTDLKDPSDTYLEGAVMANGAYGRTWNAVESNLAYDLSADLSGYTWSAIDQDSCSTNTDWTKRNNQLNIEMTQWNEITERKLLRSDTAVGFVDSDGQSSSATASTFGGIVGSDTISNLIEDALLPMHPVNLYDIFQLTILTEGLTGEHGDWAWEVGSTSTIGGQDAIQIFMHHIDIGKCLGRAEMVLWAIPGQPLPARQVVEMSIDKSGTHSSCSMTMSEAIELTFPEGTFTTRYTLEQTSFKRGTELLDWQQHYATRPLAGQDVPSDCRQSISTDDCVVWATHMWDNSSTRPFTLEQALICVTTDSDAFGAAHTALNSDGYVFAALDDRTGNSPVWNISWVSSVEAGWVRVTWPGGENCLNSGDGPISGDDKPEHARERIPTTHRIAALESRMVSSILYPDLYPQVTTSGILRDDVQIGYALVVPEDNAVSDWLDDLDFLEGQVTVYLERIWTSGDTDHSLRVGMDGKTGRMVGWAQTSTPS
ncbi:MAG: SAP domain-containing protein [Candidatus Poseidoniales archaeon]|nr:SAP domain-containing protein [Candidatus Poseidoniales archaeon]